MPGMPLPLTLKKFSVKLVILTFISSLLMLLSPLTLLIGTFLTVPLVDLVSQPGFVAMELAAALHHSRDGGLGTSVGLRAQKTASSGGRPGVLTEPEPQLVDAVLSYRAASAPLLAPPSLAAAPDDDEIALGFLEDMGLKSPEQVERMRRVEKERKRKEEEKEMQDMFARLTAEYLQGLSQSSSSSSPRKRKRRKKKKLPKASSRSSWGRARRRQRQWHSRFAGLPGDVLLRAVFPSVVVWPEMLGIMAVLNQKDSTTLVVNHGSGMCRVGFTGHDAPRVTFPSGVARPKMPSIMAGMDQKDRCTGIYKTGIDGHFAPRAVFPSLVGRPRMLGILAVADLKYSCSGIYQAGFSRVFAPRAVLPEAHRKIGLFGRWRVFHRPFVSGSHLFELSPAEYRVAFFPEMTPGMVSVFNTLLGSTVDTCSASVHEALWKNFTLSYVKGGLSDPVVDPRPSDCKLWSLRSCSSSLVVDISFAVQRQSLMVQTVRQTIDSLQLLYKVVDVPVCRSCRFPCRGAEACPMVQAVWTIVIPRLQFFDMVIDAPVVQVYRFPAPSWWRQSSSHSCRC